MIPLKYRKNIPEELFSHISNLYYFRKDTESKFVSANTAFLELCGLKSEKELIGYTDTDFFPEHIAKSYIEDDKKVMASGRPILNRIEIFSGPKGVSWVRTTKIALKDSDGKLEGLAGFSQDLTSSLNELDLFSELGPALTYVEKNLTKAIIVSDLAQKVHLSISQFERKFKARLQMTPIAYLIRLRLNAAAEDLSDLRCGISELAQKYQFYDNSHFTRHFKKQFGVSPSQYRKTNSKA